MEAPEELCFPGSQRLSTLPKSTNPTTHLPLATLIGPGMDTRPKLDQSKYSIVTLSTTPPVLVIDFRIFLLIAGRVSSIWVRGCKDSRRLIF